MKIIVDIFGADNSPHELVKGCVDSVNANKGYNIVLAGNQQVIEKELSKHEFDKARFEFLDCDQIIDNNMRPTDAIKEFKNSSLVRGLDMLKADSDAIGFLSAGNTGAVLMGSTFRVGRLDGVARPALAPLLPTFVDDRQVCLIDCGANVDCKPEYLLQFAILGDSYMRHIKGVVNPRIGLVSNGTEDKKGNELTKATFALLKQSNLNFMGNLEARDALSGDYDVLVCDGFIGNVLLKSVEGTAKMVMIKLKETLTKGGLLTKIGAGLVKKRLMTLKETMNYHSFGGAPFLGISKPIIKSHGSSDATSIAIGISQLKKMHDVNLIENMKTMLNKNQIENSDAKAN